MKRDGIDAALARKMLAQQMSNSQRLARAHDVIHNDSDDADLVTQVKTLHQTYLERAAAR
jgi:dephospho-CoA kinase